jgi:hypothetical protein
LWATTITPVVLNTWLSVATSSCFSALSTCSLLYGDWAHRPFAVGPTAQTHQLLEGRWRIEAALTCLSPQNKSGDN